MSKESRTVICQDCGEPARIRDSAPGDEAGKVRCPPCSIAFNRTNALPDPNKREGGQQQ